MNKKKILAIIPARGGSKGILKKNIRLLMGKPLIAYTIESAKSSKYLSRIVVSTEDKEIAEISKKYGAEVIDRPRELAEDSSPTFLAMEHVLSFLKNTENYKPDIVVLLQPTSPLRKASHIDGAVEKFLEEGYDSLFSACPSHALIWRDKDDGLISVNFDFKNKLRRQDVKPEYRENGAIYISSCKILTENRRILDKKFGIYLMPEENSLDIDTEFDLWLCGQIIKRNKKI